MPSYPTTGSWSATRRPGTRGSWRPTASRPPSSTSSRRGRDAGYRAPGGGAASRGTGHGCTFEVLSWDDSSGFVASGPHGSLILFEAGRERAACGPARRPARRSRSRRRRRRRPRRGRSWRRGPGPSTQHMPLRHVIRRACDCSPSLLALRGILRRGRHGCHDPGCGCTAAAGRGALGWRWVLSWWGDALCARGGGTSFAHPCESRQHCPLWVHFATSSTPALEAYRAKPSPCEVTSPRHRLPCRPSFIVLNATVNDLLRVIHAARQSPSF